MGEPDQLWQARQSFAVTDATEATEYARIRAVESWTEFAAAETLTILIADRLADSLRIRPPPVTPSSTSEAYWRVRRWPL
jgi:hypothetical protein